MLFRNKQELKKLFMKRKYNYKKNLRQETTYNKSFSK